MHSIKVLLEEMRLMGSVYFLALTRRAIVYNCLDRLLQIGYEGVIVDFKAKKNRIEFLCAELSFCLDHGL